MEWPWPCDRVEFMLAGFGNSKHIFVFNAVTLKATMPEGAVKYAECQRCGGAIFPRESLLRDHGHLHLSVELAVKELRKRKKK